MLLSLLGLATVTTPRPKARVRVRVQIIMFPRWPLNQETRKGKAKEGKRP